MLRRVGFTKAGILAAGVCSLGGLIFGYDLGALSTVAPTLRKEFHLTPLLLGLTLASSLWGTVCGSILAGHIADKIARRKLICGCAALYLFGAGTLLFGASSASWDLLIAVRILEGVAIGGLTVGCPLYLAETAPRASRGFYVGAFQLQVGVGVVLAFLVGAAGEHFIAGGGYSRLCLGLGVVPAASLLLLSPHLTASPRWLASKHRWEEANIAAGRLGLPNSEWQMDHTSSPEDGAAPSPKLFSRRFKRPLLLATSIVLFNQLSGVNVILFYLLDVLSSAGLNEMLSHNYTVFISGLNLGTTLLSMAFVDKLGRKPLLLVGSVGMSLCLFALGITIPHHAKPVWYLIILVAYNGFFAFSQGTVVWVYLSELFPFGVRGAGQGFGATVHWIANALLILLFPLLRRAAPTQGFYFFGVVMILQIAVVLFWYPETRGTSLGGSIDITQPLIEPLSTCPSCWTRTFTPVICCRCQCRAGGTNMQTSICADCRLMIRHECLKSASKVRQSTIAPP